MEGALIVGICTMVGYGRIAQTPYCETHECWLNQEKIMDKLDVFVRPEHLAAFQQGDLGPLEQARPRVPASGQFARLTLKYSDQCHDYCALCIANVTTSLDKNGKTVEKKQELLRNLWVPKTMFDYLAKFDHPTAQVP